jgi:FtsP/CotA-like multicopper oxidase with cupredoxin domain
MEAETVNNGRTKKKIDATTRLLPVLLAIGLMLFLVLPNIMVAAQAAAPAMNPGGLPHYFGPWANWANSPMPKGAIASITLVSGGIGYIAPVVTLSDVYYTGTGASATAIVDPATGTITGITLVNGGSGFTAPIVTITDPGNPLGTGASATASLSGSLLTGGIRKFVDTLPGLGIAGANTAGQYIPVAVPDTTTYPGSDYYVIELGEYNEKMHPDLPNTTLRGYRQVNAADPTVTKFSYLGPLIVAQKDRAVRIKFINSLPTGTGGNLFIPVDKTVMGAGMGPLGMSAMPMDYTQNRATLHLHGGLTPWISDGTPHQWTTPAGEMTPYPEGVSVYNVPDMDGGVEPQGTLTFYYTNQQSARLMFYHDHAYGITRLNVYVGEAAGYLITDQAEQDMIQGTDVTGINPTHAKVLPDIGTPLIIQDKTFVDSTTIAAQDPTWAWGTTPGTPNTGDLWYPHVYMPNQNPYDVTGLNNYGRWDYAPWASPATTTVLHGPTANPYYDPVNAPWEPPFMPTFPNTSMVMESFMDTPLVNGAAYPNMTVEPKAYRFRILDAANDRFQNLQLYVADPTVTSADGRTNTEVKMVPAVATPGFPASWPTDGRAGGVPDPATAGPSFIQIGTEGGFLPAPVVIPNQPITWDPATGNAKDHALYLGCAERADVIIDFSQYAGQTLILYNDAPAPAPGMDSRYDYYTNDSDQTSSGGAPPTQPGYGPNTRTIMQIKVAAQRTDGQPIAAYDLAALQAVFAKTAAKRGVFEASQDPIIVSQAAYDSAYNANFPVNAYVAKPDTSMSFSTISGNLLNITFMQKAIQDDIAVVYDTEYGRGSGLLGLQLNATAQAMYPYYSPPVDIMVDCVTPAEPSAGDGTQLWKITHMGVDTHPVHFHLFNVQLINRIATASGAILPPDANELGWKETIKMNPQESIIVAIRPVAPTQPFEIPNSVREIDATMPDGAALPGPAGGFLDPAGNPITVTNHIVNYGWEYVYHCHILSHEEMDMMHAMVFAVAPRAPTGLSITQTGANRVLTWNDNSITETGFTLQRADNEGFTAGLMTFTVGANVNTFIDNTYNTSQTYYYRVQANNLVGDTAVHAGSAGFPTQMASSAFSNTVIYPTAVPNSAFVGTTIPDAMVAADTYTVTVTFTNNGTTAWSSANGDKMVMWGQLYAFNVGGNTGTFNGIPSFDIPAGVTVLPGQSYAWTFNLTPQWSGNYGLGFQVVEGNQWLGNAGSKAITVSPESPNALFVADTIPATQVEGDRYNVSITYTNTGNSAWTSGKGDMLVMWGQLWAFDLAGNDTTYNGIPAFSIPAGVTVQPGQSFTWNLTLTSRWSGSFGLGFQVVEGSIGAWLGASTTKAITVAAASPNALFVNSTIPGTMTLGNTYNSTVTFSNTGNSAWTSGKGDVLVMWGQTWAFGIGNDTVYNGASAFSIPAGVTVQPGQTYTWTVPLSPLWSGTFRLDYQVVQGSTGTWLGAFAGNTITV